MERPTAPVVVTTRTTGHSRGLDAILVVIAAGLVLSIVKPWAPAGKRTADGPAPGAENTRGAVGVPGASAVPMGAAIPVATPGAAGVAGLPAGAGAGASGPCFFPSSWELVVDRSLANYRTRDWIVVHPAPAAGPRDPRIPVTPLDWTAVTALGFCAPPASGGPDRPLSATIWRVSGAGPGAAAAVVAARIATAPGVLGDVAPPPGGAGGTDPGAGPPPWPPARYVIEIESDAGAADPLWLAVTPERQIAGEASAPAAVPSGHPAF